MSLYYFRQWLSLGFKGWKGIYGIEMLVILFLYLGASYRVCLVCGNSLSCTLSICIFLYLYYTLVRSFRGFPGDSVVKNLPAKQKMWVGSLGQEDPLEKGMATHSSILAWKNPVGSGAWWAKVHRVAKSQTWLSGWPCTYQLSSAGTRMQVDRRFSKLKSRIPRTYSYIVSSSLCFCFKDLEISHFLPKEKNKHIHLGKIVQNCDL